jgi:mono/diheme cytochrome c family protein
MRQLITILLALVATTAIAADGTQILESQCASCHALKKPEAATLDHIWDRKAPDLYYAGNKFQHDWLVTWLQAPTRIRPGGEFYRKHIKSTPDGDVIDTATLSEHPRLDKAAAESAATALMALVTPGLVEAGGFKNGPVSATMGKMFFGKLRGCSACHQDAVDKGGFSAPELYDAGQRLQADYVYSYIKQPQAFDPHVWMPNLGLGEADLQRITGYIMQLKEGVAQLTLFCQA